MIDMPVEKFTAEEAVAIGLADAVKSGAVKISGSYELKTDGLLEFKQKTFNFTDKLGAVHFAQFKNSDELEEFANWIEFWKNAHHN